MMKAFSKPEKAKSLKHLPYFKFLLVALIINLCLLPNYTIAKEADKEAALSCIGDIQVSIGLDGTITLTPQMLLVGNYPDYDVFIVDIEGPLEDELSCDEVGQSFTVSVIDTVAQNSCWSTVHVEDKVKPQIDCSEFDILCAVDYSEEDYSFFITVSDNCTPEENLEIWYNESITNLDCDPDNAAIVERTWYVSDESGNQQSCEQTINIIKPDLMDVVFPSDTIVYCPIPNTNPDSLGVPTVDGIPIDPFCEIVSWHTDLSSDICNGSFVITRTWNVMDWCDLTTVTGEQTITVLDSTPPVLVCPDDLTLFTGEDDCEAQITLPVSGASDTCGEDSLIQIMIIIDGVPGYEEEEDVVLEVGNHLISYRATDDCGNVSTCSYNVIIADTITPVLNCLAVVEISTGGDVNLAVSAGTFPHIYTDNCELADTLVRRVETHCNKPADLEFGPGISFCCDDVEENVIAEMLVIDESGNSNSCVFEIDFTETEPPTVTCKDTILFLDENGTASVNTIELYTEIDDNCVVDTVEATINEFTCLHIGINDVVVTVTDQQGNTGTCISQVTVEDTIDPVCIAKDITIALDDTGNLLLTGLDVDDNSTDECGIETYDVNPSAFDCSDIGSSTEVTLTVIDTSGNSSNCTSMVTVIDTTSPECITQDISVQLDEMGTSSITSADVDNGSNDECSGVLLSVDPSTFGCNDVGANTVILTVEDDSGNQSTCEAIVTVQDTTPPIALCQDITIELDDTGNYNLTGAEIDNGSSDNCNVASLSSVPGAIDCNDIGSITATLTVTDDDGNTDTCDANIEVQDTTSPVAICMDITISLDPMTGEYNLDPTEVDNGSNDNCDTNLDLSVNPDQFFCNDIGDETVILTVEDDSGNTDTCEAIVTVTEMVEPMCISQDITVFVDDNGMVMIDSNAVDNGSIDPCGTISEISVSPNSFDCSNLGPNDVVMTVMDEQGNVSSCDAIVTVQDTTSPICISMDITVSLDGSQMATINGDDVDNNSTDNCGTLTTSVVPTSFNCSDLGPNTVTLTVEDGSMNISSCEAVVTVQDTTPPMAICQDITVFLDDLGSSTITPGQIDNGSNDDCSSVMLSLNNDLFLCNDVGNNTVILTATDDSGNSDTCEANVTVQDTTSPMAICQDITIQLDVNGEASITGLDINNGSTDNCTIISLEADPTSFSCANLGANSVDLTVTDINTNTGTCTAIVTVEDTIPPIAICQDITVQLDGLGEASITGVDVDGGSSDNCNLGGLIPNPSSFDCSNLGDVDVILTVTDNSANESTCLSIVTVEDTIPPAAICQDVTIYVDGNGSAILNPDDLNNGSTDNCASLSFTASETNFDCADLGLNDVTLFATDDSGNMDSCVSVVTVLDTVPPVALCQDITIQLDNNGNASILGSDVNNNSTDNCNLSSLMVNPSDFDCGDVGDVAVILTVSDSDGNDSTCNALVTVMDTVPPIALCQDITADLDVNGMITISPDEVNNGSDDACGIFNTSLDITDFTCMDVGLQSVVLTVEDNNGNISTCSAQVSVEDNVAPNAICQDITIYLDNTGNASITGPDIDNGSTDACIVVSLIPDISDFTCTDVGDNTVILTVTDANNNASTCISTVNVQDTIPPVAICQDITIQLDASGNASITPSDIDGGSNDECTPLGLSVDISDFTCTDVGPNTVILTVMDANGNNSTCASNVTVMDTIPPVALCQDITIQLDMDGMVSITAADVDGGSNDACGIFDLAINQTDFTCADIGVATVVLTVTDVNSNVSSCNALVTIEDDMNPVAVCQDVTIFVDDMGNAVLDVNDVDNGSSDNCSNITLSLNIQDFDCNNIGSATTVTLTVSDASGNSDTCLSQVSVADTTSPVALCQDITIQLDPTGNAVITGLDVNNGSTDNCGIASIIPNPQLFDCNDLGVNSVILTVTDDFGNIGTCESMVTVQDTTPPVALCQDITIQLDGTGNASADPSNVDNGSNDECTTISLSLNVTDFTCADIGSNPVILTVTDGSGNLSTCNANVIVEDNVPPNAICQDVTIQLDASGNGSIAAGDIDNGSTDNCEIQSIVVEPTDFTCADLGTNPVILTVTDVNGNFATCNATVTVLDTTPPSALCQDITVLLDVTGVYDLTPVEIDNGSSDICDEELMMSVIPMQLTCMDIGVVMVTLTVTDDSGNSDTCISNVTVTDEVSPTCVNQDIIAYLDANGTVEIDSNAVDGGSIDDCGMIVEITTAPNSFNCSNLGDNTVTMTVTDNSGNQSSCSANVSVQDTVSPVALCQDITIQLDNSGNAEIMASQIDGGSTDNCVTVSLSADPTQFTCSDVGIVSSTLTVTDGSSNMSTCVATVTVQDTTPPNAICQDVTIQLDNMGNVALTAAEVDNGSNDVCSSVSLSIDNTSYTCSDLGLNQVVLTVTDLAGNNATCNANVTVADTVPPIAMCKDATVQLESDGTLILFGSVINDNSTDNCNISSLLPTPGILDCGDIGTVSVILRVTDSSGNSSTCESSVTVEDVTPPVAICQDITLILDENGEGTITPDQVDNGSTDECDLMLDLNLDITNFFCNDIGVNIVNLTVTDDSGNSSSCMSNVTVMDTIAPICLTQDVTIYLDDTGMASIDSNTVDNMSSDVCGFITEFATTPNTFSCTEVGLNIVTMTVTDDGGNQSSCDANVSVQDTTSPAITCVDITINIQPDETATANVSDFIVSASDNCTLEANLILTFEMGVDSTTTVFDCSNVGNEATEVFVIDEQGNFTSCKVGVVITDTDNVCPPGFTGTIQGRVLGEFAELVDEYDVKLNNEDEVIVKSILTGPYSFENLELGKSYELSVSKDNGWKNGLTLMDYDLMVSHIIQENLFESPYQYIAADLDNNEKISAFDAVWLKRLLIDYVDNIDGNESWRFVNMYHDFSSSNPLLEEIPEIISFDPLLEDKFSVDFLAIKTGDLDGDSKKSGLNDVEVRNYETYVIETNNMVLQEGEEFVLDFKLCNPECLVDGIQLSINLEMFDFLGFDESVQVHESDFNFIEEKSVLKLIMSKHEYDFDNIDHLGIRLQAKESGELKTMVSDLFNNDFSRIYTNEQKPLIPSLRVLDRISESDELDVNVSPNPFSNELSIDIETKEAGLTIIEIFDAFGRKVYSKRAIVESGLHQFIISSKDLSSAGIYNLIITKNDRKINKKILLIN